MSQDEYNELAFWKTPEEDFLYRAKYGDYDEGYSPEYLKANEQYQEMGLLCKYEHGIENMPLLPDENEGSCPVFGHQCPGGIIKVAGCHAYELVWGHPLEEDQQEAMTEN